MNNYKSLSVKFKIDLNEFKPRIIKNMNSTPWDFGNSILYKLCKDNPTHDKLEIVIAKIWLIGRSYAAAIERRKEKSSGNDDFYINRVAPAIRESKLDDFLADLEDKDINESNILNILKIHKYLSGLFKQLTGLNKISLSSKYLHFHKPELFFIYDSRAAKALRVFISRIPSTFSSIIKSNEVDPEYAKYFIKSFITIKRIETDLNLKLTSRAFDNLLIDIANNDT